MGNQLYCRCNDCCDSCRTLCNLRGRGPLYVHKTDDVGAFLKAFPTCPLAFPLIIVCYTNGIGRTHQYFCLLHLKVDALNHIADSLLLSTTLLFVIHTSPIDLTRRMDSSQAHSNRKAYTLSRQLSIDS